MASTHNDKKNVSGIRGTSVCTVCLFVYWGLRAYRLQRSFCAHNRLYCQKPQSTPAHLERKHGNEGSVQQALSCAEGTKERLEMWESIRNRGNYAHNVQVKLGKKKRRASPLEEERKGTKNMLMTSCCATAVKDSFLERLFGGTSAHLQEAEPEKFWKSAT